MHAVRGLAQVSKESTLVAVVEGRKEQLTTQRESIICYLTQQTAGVRGREKQILNNFPFHLHPLCSALAHSER